MERFEKQKGGNQRRAEDGPLTRPLEARAARAGDCRGRSAGEKREGCVVSSGGACS